MKTLATFARPPGEDTATKTIRFPIRRSSSTRLPATSSRAGSTERTKNGLITRTRSIGRPMILGRNASMYAITSGNSGMARA